MPSNARKSSALNEAQKEFLLGELIGKRLRVVFSSDKSRQGVFGEIVDETLNAFCLQTDKGRITVPKNSCTFAFDDAGFEVDGQVLLHRPQDRTKKLYARFNKGLKK